MTDDDWKELEKYGELCNDSYGAAVLAVIDLHSCGDYISGKLQNMLETESDWNLANFKQNAEITPREEIITQK